MATIIDREIEQVILQRLAAAGELRLALVYGRRRVGKTYLLTHVWPQQQVFYFTAGETTEAQNRETLVREYAEWSRRDDVRIEDYPTWRTVFRLLLDHVSDGAVVVVLDEFQYMGTDKAALASITSELNAAWETRRDPRPFVLVLSGSSVRLMEALDEAGAPLYGRVHWKHRMAPFDYYDAARMAPFEELRDRVGTYGIFGGMPRYLADLDVRRPLGENVANLMLAPGGSVRILAETAILQEQGLRDPRPYIAILRAVATGATTLNEIHQAAGLKADTAFSVQQKLARLIEMGFVRRGRNLEAGPKEAYRYAIADPATRFYYRYVAPMEATLARTDPAIVWREVVEPNLDTFLGPVFEDVAAQAYVRLQASRGLPLVKEWGRWEGVDKDRAATEIDIAALLVKRQVLTGLVKWSSRPIPLRWFPHHEDALRRLAASGVKWARAATEPASPLFCLSAAGYSPEFEQAAAAGRPTRWLWSLEDIYPPG